MAVRNLYALPVLIMTEIDLPEGPLLTWVAPGEAYAGGHDGVAAPGLGMVWKCLGRQIGPVFLGAGTTVGEDGQARGLLTFSLRNTARFCLRYPEWRPLYDVALCPKARPDTCH